MITFKSYQHASTKVNAACFDGSLKDAEDLEAIYKGKVRLEFRGIFTGNMIVEDLGRQRQLLKPGDYLVDSEHFSLFCLEPDLFKKYYEALK